MLPDQRTLGTDLGVFGVTDSFFRGQMTIRLPMQVLETPLAGVYGHRGGWRERRGPGTTQRQSGLAA